MALLYLLRKLPALGLRSPPGPLMGPVHAPSPAACYRHMSSHARTGYVDPCPRVNELLETLDKQNAENKKAHMDMQAIVCSDVAKWDVLSKAVFYPINAFTAFHLLWHLF